MRFELLKKKIILSAAITVAVASLCGCGGVSQAEYDELKSRYDDVSAYAVNLEEKVRYLEALNAAYDSQLNQYIKEEQAGNKVIIVEPMTEGGSEE